jgi:hypothetical protein
MRPQCWILWSVRGEETAGGDAVLDGRYRLLRRFDSGGMTVVWMARDERLGRDVAVKILSDVLACDADYRRRSERRTRGNPAGPSNGPGVR